MTDMITPRQFHESEGVEDWRVLSEGARTFFRTTTRFVVPSGRF